MTERICRLCDDPECMRWSHIARQAWKDSREERRRAWAQAWADMPASIISGLILLAAAWVTYSLAEPPRWAALLTVALVSWWWINRDVRRD